MTHDLSKFKGEVIDYLKKEGFVVFCGFQASGRDEKSISLIWDNDFDNDYKHFLKVARTIADLEGNADIMPQHISEAIQYRSLDRNLWL